MALSKFSEAKEIIEIALLNHSCYDGSQFPKMA